MFRTILRILLALILLLIIALAVARWAASNRETASAESLVPPGGRMVETSLGAVHAIEAGPEDGQPVILIHGSVGWSLLWEDTLADLATRGYRAIAIDLAPMGLSDRAENDDYARQAQGARILSFAATLPRKPIIVAHSFGGGAAAEALVTAPQAFQGGVIVAGAIALGKNGPEPRERPIPGTQLASELAISATATNPLLTGFLFRQFIHRKDALTDRHVAIVETAFKRQGTTPALARWLPTLLFPPHQARSSDPAAYTNLPIPVALIWGREDTVTPPDQGEALAAALGGAPLTWLEDVGHIPQIEAPDLFHAALAEALASMEN